MKVTATRLDDVKLVEPQVHGDERGFFLESWNRELFYSHGLATDFVQDNHSRSSFGVLRGMHYQTDNPQGKLVRVTRGAVFDVAIDVRSSSPQFGMWVGETLSEENWKCLWIPPGFAHGFLVLSDFADFQYKCTEYYDPCSERCLAWDDATVGIEWPLAVVGTPKVSEKDGKGLSLDACD